MVDVYQDYAVITCAKGHKQNIFGYGAWKTHKHCKECGDFIKDVDEHISLALEMNSVVVRLHTDYVI